jgi:hypothetical protein
MARSDQIARQQRRAFSIFQDSLPGTVTIDATDYDVALAPGTSEHETEDGTITTPQAIGFWLPKSDHPAKPTTRTRVTWNGTDYFIHAVEGDGDSYQNWKVDAARHRP